MKIKINWQEPKTELDHLVLTMLLWHDIWKHNYFDEVESKYYKYSEGYWFFFYLFYICGADYMYDLFGKWKRGNIDGAKQIYLKCKAKAKELIKKWK